MSSRKKNRGDRGTGRNEDLGERFKFRAGDSFGNIAGENDEYLIPGFVDIGVLQEVLKPTSPKVVLLGRTGAGKSALLRYTREKDQRVVEIAPESLALAHITNSNILRFLDELKVNLEPFFKLLWRHVIAIEVLQRRTPREETRRDGPFAWLKRKLAGVGSDKQYERALNYLNKWGPSFWESTERRVEEITKTIEGEVEGTLGASIGPANSQFRTTAGLSQSQRESVVSRTQQVINQVQVRELNEILQLLDAVFDDEQKPILVTIDRLDEDWIEDSLRYRLIRCLIETCKDFIQVKNVKVLVALREDILERIMAAGTHAGFQREKYEALCLPLRWTRDQLEEVMDTRSKQLVSRVYTSQAVRFRDLYKPAKGHRGGEPDPADFVIERTLGRPRDVVAYLNSILEFAADKPQISMSHITRAELPYSKSRMRALEDEWTGTFPWVGRFLTVLQSRPERFEANQIDPTLENLALEIALIGEAWDPFDTHPLCVKIAEGTIPSVAIRGIVLFVLHRIGALRAKSQPNAPFEDYPCRSGPISGPAGVNEHSHFEVHPAFRAALNAGRPDYSWSTGDE